MEVSFFGVKKSSTSGFCWARAEAAGRSERLSRARDGARGPLQASTRQSESFVIRAVLACENEADVI
jgi:hypothetical protein